MGSYCTATPTRNTNTPEHHQRQQHRHTLTQPPSRTRNNKTQAAPRKHYRGVLPPPTVTTMFPFFLSFRAALDVNFRGHRVDRRSISSGEILRLPGDEGGAHRGHLPSGAAHLPAQEELRRVRRETSFHVEACVDFLAPFVSCLMRTEPRLRGVGLDV